MINEYGRSSSFFNLEHETIAITFYKRKKQFNKYERTCPSQKRKSKKKKKFYSPNPIQVFSTMNIALYHDQTFKFSTCLVNPIKISNSLAQILNTLCCLCNLLLKTFPVTKKIRIEFHHQDRTCQEEGLNGTSWKERTLDT